LRSRAIVGAIALFSIACGGSVTDSTSRTHGSSGGTGATSGPAGDGARVNGGTTIISGSSGGIADAGGMLGSGGIAFGFGGSGNVIQIGSGGQPGVDPCTTIEAAADPMPLDLYVMFDQSSSLSAAVAGASPPITWWQAAQTGVTNFVEDPRAVGTGVGIQYFPYHGSIAGPDPGVPSSSCYVPNYATPEVEIGLLPGNASAIVQSIQSHAPTTFTPTAAALEGAIQHMQAWGAAHPGRQPAVVLVTDGFATECDPQDPSLIAELAKAAYDGSPRVVTFVVGLEDGEALDNLSQIAKAGGTSNANLIKGGDIAAQFVDVMLGLAVPPAVCSYPVPPSLDPANQTLNLNEVVVTFMPAAIGVPEHIPRLDDVGQCASASDGWYYDAPPPNSKAIFLCPSTCSKFATGSIYIKFGCMPTPVPSH